MSRALYTAVSGLKSHQTRMDVIGNNIANVSTYGFKTSRVTFRDVFYQNMSSGSAPTAEGAGMGGQNPSQVGYGAMVGSIDTNQAKTGYAPTGYATDCYVNGEGFFVVTDTATDGESGNIKYTRLGAFDFDSAGNLVDSNGQYVCGFEMPEVDGVVVGALSAIKFDIEAEGTPLSNISIGADGKLTALNSSGIRVGFTADGALTEDPDNDACMGIAIANIPNPGGMIMDGNSYYVPSGNAGLTEDGLDYYQAGTNNMGSLKTGGLEMSATDISQEFSDMIMTQRGFQANSRIVSVVDSMLEEVVNLKR